MLKLRFQLWFWRSLGQLAICLRDSGQRCFTWYEQHSPMGIVTDGKPMAAQGSGMPPVAAELDSLGSQAESTAVARK